MQRFICRFLAAASLLAWWGNSEMLSRPRYGGILRVEMHESIRSLDPAEWPANGTDPAKEKLIPLIFEQLVRLDETGQTQAALATSWQHDSKNRRWQFYLRPDVKFHDGTVLTPELAAVAMRALPAMRAPSRHWKINVLLDSLVIELDKPEPDLLYDLAQPSHSIFLRGAGQKVFGTGPFQLTEWDPGRGAVLSANEQHWTGRPFLDGIVIQMGRPLAAQLVDLELGNADFIEVWPDVRKFPKNARKWPPSSDHVLIALAFERGRTASENARMREALSLCIDREAIYNGYLQKQGAIAAALLPQKVSGYAFLFPTGLDTKRAQQLAAMPGQSPPALVLSYDSNDPLAGSMARRIALNARDAGIIISVSGKPLNSDVRLVRIPISTPIPGKALAGLFESLRLTDAGPVPATASIEALYAAESGVLSEHWVIPLFHIPEIYGLNPRLKTWTTSGIDAFGNWHFEDMWLEIEKP